MKITSVNNDFVKDLVRLQKKKYRDLTGTVLLEGEHLIEEARRANLIIKSLGVGSVYDIEISESVADKLSLTKSGSKEFALIKKPTLEKIRGNRFLMCDGVQDPGNMGTIIRTAYSFGFDAIFLSDDCVDETNDKVIRATQGAYFHIPVIRESLLKTIKRFKDLGIPTYATYLGEGTHRLQDIISNPIAVVVGSEGNGVSKDVIESCEGTVKIETSNFESLNVAIATGILCYVLRKE